MRLADYVWTSTGGSSGYIGSPVQLFGQGVENAVLIEHSTGCTGTISFDTAQESTGPFVSLGSTTTNSSLAEAFRLNMTGPLGDWVQPRFTSAPTTGYFRIRLTIVG